VAKATVCKVSPRNLVRVRKPRNANAGPLPPFFVAGQKGTGEDALGLSCGPNSVTGRKRSGAVREPHDLEAVLGGTLAVWYPAPGLKVERGDNHCKRILELLPYSRGEFVELSFP
jgi:hypothetical protein